MQCIVKSSALFKLHTIKGHHRYITHSLTLTRHALQNLFWPDKLYTTLLRQKIISIQVHAKVDFTEKFFYEMSMVLALCLKNIKLKHTN